MWRHWCCQCSSLDLDLDLGLLGTLNNFSKTGSITGVSLTSNFQQNYRSLKSRKSEMWGLAAQRKRTKLVE